MNVKYTILLKDTFIFALGSFGSKIILFFMVPLYTNYMTTEEYGIADLVFTVAQFLTPIMSIVIHDAVIRYGLSKEYRKEDVLRVGYTIIIVDIIIAVVIVPMVAAYTPLKPWRWYLSLYSVLCILDSIQFNYLKACEKNRLFAGLSILKTGCMALFNVVFLAILQIGIRGYLIANILALMITNIFVFILGNFIKEFRHSHWNVKLFKEMVRYSVPLVLNNISWWVIQSSDKVMIEYMLGAAALGIYTVAAKIPALINVIINVFSQAWGISSIHEYENSNDTSFYSKVQKIYMMFVCAACVGYVSIIKIFMSFYVGAGFLSAWRYIPLLLVSAVFSSISSFYGSLYGALKKTVSNMCSTFFSALINIGVNLILIPVWGIWGAVVGTLLAYIFIAIYRLIDVRHYIFIEVEWKIFLLNCLIIVLQAIFVSLDIYGWIVSGIAVILFLVNNYKTVYQIVANIKIGGS